MFLSMFCTWQALWFPNLHHIRFRHPVCAALAQSSGTQPSSRCIIWVQWIPIAPHPRQNILKKWCANHSLKLCGLGVQYIDIKPGSLHLQEFSISVWKLLTWKSSTNNNISIFWVPVQHKQVIWGHLEARTQLSYDKKFPNNFVSIVASIVIYFRVNRKWWSCMWIPKPWNNPQRLQCVTQNFCQQLISKITTTAASTVWLVMQSQKKKKRYLLMCTS